LAPKLHVIVCSTRPGRVGLPVGRWFHEIARQHGGFDPVLVDLAEFDLPIYDEPKHPRLQQYEHAHTKRWSESVAAADAFVFVTPEYNYGPSPSFVNALNYVYNEWNYKPAGLVSYGGVSGGLRAAQIEKLTLLALKMVPINEAVTVCSRLWTHSRPPPRSCSTNSFAGRRRCDLSGRSSVRSGTGPQCRSAAAGSMLHRP
jgi:NAD(P)H-dependent FMN reductase